MKPILSRLDKAMQFILNAQTQSAFDTVDLTFDSIQSTDFNEVKKDFRKLQARYRNLEKEIKRGVINYEQYTLQRNKINGAFIDMLDEFREQIKRSPEQELGKLIKDSNAKNAVKRTETIVQNLKILAEGNNFGLVREKGNLSTFSLPNRSTDNPAWKHLTWKNDDDGILTGWLSQQRYWMEKHALNRSCKVIVHLEAGFQSKSEKHGLYRLKALLEFVKNHRDRVDIINAPPEWAVKRKEAYENLLIVGNKDDLDNSFLAHSRIASDGSGIKDTYISPEPIDVKQYIVKFDQEFDELLNYLQLDIYEARNQVIEWLEDKIGQISKKGS